MRRRGQIAWLVGLAAPGFGWLGNASPAAEDFDRMQAMAWAGLNSTVAQALAIGGAMLALAVLCFMHVRMRRQANAVRDRLVSVTTFERHFSQLFEEAADVVYTANLEGRFTSINRAGERLSGYTREEALNLTIPDICAPEYRDVILERMARRQQGEAPPALEVVMLTKHGQRVDLEVSNQLVFEAGKPAGMQGIARDITERKQAERHVKALTNLGHRLSVASSAENAARIIAQSADHLLGWDSSTVDLYSAAENRVSPLLTMDTLDGQKTDVDPPCGAVEPCPFVAKVIREGARMVLREDGEADQDGLMPFGDTARRSLSLMFAPVRHQDRVIGVISIQSYRRQAYQARDLQTLQALADFCGGALERLRTETALREMEALYRQAISASNGVPYRYDFAGDHYAFMGEGIEALTGYPALEFKPAVWRGLIEETTLCGDLAGLSPEEGMRRAKTSQLKRWQADHRLRVRDGSTRWVTNVAIPILTEHGRIIEFVGILFDVTEHRRSEAALRDAEQRYHSIFDNAVEGIFQTTPDGRFLNLNPALARMYGYDSPEAARTEVTDVGQRVYVDPNQRAEYQRLIEAHGAVVNYEYEIYRRDGSTIWVSENSHAVRGSHGELRHYEGTIIDITERRRAEEALRRSEQQFKAFMGNSPALTFIKDAEGRYVYANVAWERQFSPPRTDWGGQTDLDFWPVETARLFRDSDLAALAADRTVEKIESGFTPAGERRYWMVYKFAITDSQGRRLVGGISLDITARQQTETALRQSEDLLAKAFHASPSAIVITTLDQGRYLNVNEGFLRMFGYRREDVLGQTDIGLDIWNNPEQREQMVRTLRSGLPVRNLECQFRTKSRELRTALTSVERIELGSDACLLFLKHDITERLQLEAQFRQAQKMESVGQLAAGVAHDFNNILTIIQGYASLLQTLVPAAPETADCVKQITDASLRAANLTRQLLAFSRRQVMRPIVVDLNEVIGQLTRMLQRMLGEDIALEFNYSSGLPPTFADPSLLEQVVMNLAINARDAMPAGGRLIVSTHATVIDAAQVLRNPEANLGEHLCLTVTDTGSGMDAATLARIFEPFFTTKEVGKGTGLGLATVYGIVRQHHGWVEVRSQPGHGSTFRVYLPSHSKPVEERPAFAVPKLEVVEGRETILLVEDETPLRGLARRVLEKCGYRVLEASSGKEALAVWAEWRPEVDLLLTDMVMPEGMTGRELARRLQEQDPGLKVLFTSGYSVDIVGKDFTLLEGINFLPKPYRPVALTQAVRNCLDGRLDLESPEPRAS